MSSYRMLVTQVGFDVFKATNKQLVFSSDLATHSIQSINNITLTAGSSTYPITHNLGYAPKVWAMAFNSTSSYYYRLPDLDNRIDYYITTTQVIIETGFTFNLPIACKVIIFTRSFKP